MNSQLAATATSLHINSTAQPQSYFGHQQTVSQRDRLLFSIAKPPSQAAAAAAAMAHNSTETLQPGNHAPFTRDAAAGFVLGALGGIIGFSFSYLVVCFGLNALRSRRLRQREQRELLELIEMMGRSDSGYETSA
ncbi:hypothetical protein FPSE_08864 [Fusarium pseudograminearum CS3096]|uniref:Uncharacterized protein n=1 Tax=Fusarium pseudograminearum (strain CS3096) TaxID=1028729 RepID=K3VYP4_FUSPC|nr:hypothetical protein FPSE_08864 [Fusarium pseudograminearum CS3096]EKJ71005.1 hypothetical protein FPSE_08864 [Fusarium pseudograminearum CS3096]KAF0640277.1 hypothetical protein FPSE5266_08864 [Fusarium pseudograminearum]